MSNSSKPSFISRLLLRSVGAIEAFRNAEKRGQSFNFGEGGYSSFNDWFSGNTENDTDINVTSELGSKMGTVWGCLNILSQDTATLPCQVRQKTEDGKEVITNNITKLLNKKPNRYENAWQFMYGMVFFGEGWGNSYAYIFRNERNEPTELVRLAPWSVEPKVIEGDLFYQVDGGKWTIPARDIIHYRSFILDDVKGISKIEYNANLIGLKKKQDQYAGRTTNTKIPGYLYAENATSEQENDIKVAWNAAVRGDNISGTPFLKGGVKYEQLMISPEASEIVALTEWTDTQTIGLWRIQPSMLSNHKNSNYSNAEQQALNHVKFTLQPILTCLEQEFNEKLFSERNKQSKSPQYVKFNMHGLLRGDIQAQTAYLQAQRTSGIINADEWRALDDRPKQKDSKGNTGIGEKYLVQGAMVDIESIDSSIETEQRAKQEIEGILKKYKINGYSKQ